MDAFFVGLLLSIVQSMLVVAWLVGDQASKIDFDIDPLATLKSQTEVTTQIRPETPQLAYSSTADAERAIGRFDLIRSPAL
ncbi:MAG: hypothetical protein WAK97_10185 [Pseudolabrys sp.]